MRSTVKRLTKQVLKLTTLLSFIFGGVFLIKGEKIGLLIYNSADVGTLLTALAPIVPFMYLDSVSDGILKGLDQQTFTFRTALSDSTLRIILILLMLPIMGMKGFIYIMYFSNFLTCFLNVKRLCKVSGASLKPIKEILIPLTLSLFTVFIADQILNLIKISSTLISTILFSALSVTLYVLLLEIFKIASFKEILQSFRR